MESLHQWLEFAKTISTIFVPALSVVVGWYLRQHQGIADQIKGLDTRITQLEKSSGVSDTHFSGINGRLSKMEQELIMVQKDVSEKFGRLDERNDSNFSDLNKRIDRIFEILQNFKD